jgi:hypothetical protein
VISLTIDDLLIIAIILWVLLILIILFKYMKNRKIEMNVLKKAKKDRIDLEAITRNIEENYKPAAIRLTSYEEEQESNAIISYQELLTNKDNQQINYDDEYQSKIDLNVKKVDLEGNMGTEMPRTKIEVSLMNYKQEEDFLKALKKLQSDLVR